MRRSRAIPLLVWSERLHGARRSVRRGPRRYTPRRRLLRARAHRRASQSGGIPHDWKREVSMSPCPGERQRSGLWAYIPWSSDLSRPPFPTCRWLEQGNLVYPGDPEKASAAASSGYWLGPFFSSVPRFRHWGFSWPIARPGAGRGRGGPSSRQDVRAQPDSGQCPCATFDDLCEEKGHPAARAAHGCCDEGR